MTARCIALLGIAGCNRERGVISRNANFGQFMEIARIQVAHANVKRSIGLRVTVFGLWLDSTRKMP